MENLIFNQTGISDDEWSRQPRRLASTTMTLPKNDGLDDTVALSGRAKTRSSVRALERTTADLEDEATSSLCGPKRRFNSRYLGRADHRPPSVDH